MIHLLQSLPAISRDERGKLYTLSSKQRRKAKRLIRAECCNYDALHNECLLFGVRSGRKSPHMQRDFDRSYYNVRYLLKDPAYVEPVLKLYHEKLPLTEMEGDQLDDPCMGEEYKDYAYHYYLQADYAARLRAKEDDFFGNTTVVINVRKALEETEALLPEDFFKEVVAYDFPGLFIELTNENHRCVLSKGEASGHGIELTAERIPTRTAPDPEELLVTIPQLKYCERTLKVSYMPNETAEIWFKDDGAKVRYDFCTWNDIDDRVEFYYDEELVAWVRSEKCRILRKPAAEAEGPEYRIVSVKFEASGRTYDYICELADMQPGDIVIVNGYNGETEVTVTKIVTRRESEVGLPADRYKKILRKA